MIVITLNYCCCCLLETY